MKRFSRSFVLAAAVAILGGLGTVGMVRAEAAATGTLTGKVLDDKGAPAKGVHVAALLPGALADRKKSAADAPDATKDRPKALAKAVTADDGTYTLTDVPVGKVRVIAGAKGAGLGIARELVQVTAGQTVKVPDIKLRTAADRPKGAKPGAGENP